MSKGAETTSGGPNTRSRRRAAENQSVGDKDKDGSGTDDVLIELINQLPAVDRALLDQFLKITIYK